MRNRGGPSHHRATVAWGAAAGVPRRRERGRYGAIGGVGRAPCRLRGTPATTPRAKRCSTSRRDGLGSAPVAGVASEFAAERRVIARQAARRSDRAPRCRLAGALHDAPERGTALVDTAVDGRPAASPPAVARDGKRDDVGVGRRNGADQEGELNQTLHGGRRYGIRSGSARISWRPRSSRRHGRAGGGGGCPAEARARPLRSHRRSRPRALSPLRGTRHRPPREAQPYESAVRHERTRSTTQATPSPIARQ